MELTDPDLRLQCRTLKGLPQGEETDGGEGLRKPLVSDSDLGLGCSHLHARMLLSGLWASTCAWSRQWSAGLGGLDLWGLQPETPRPVLSMRTQTRQGIMSGQEPGGHRHCCGSGTSRMRLGLRGPCLSPVWGQQGQLAQQSPHRHLTQCEASWTLTLPQ